MTPDSSHDVLAPLAAQYALGGLDGSERDVFEQHLEVCRTCVNEVSSLLPVTRALAFMAPVQTPPARLRDRVVGPTTSSNPGHMPSTPTREPAASTPRVPLPPRQPAAMAPPRAGHEPRRMSTGFKLMALLCLVIAGGLGWYAAQQVNMARDLRTQIDGALLRERVAALDASTARQLAEESRGRTDILADTNARTVALEGQPGAEASVGRAFLSPTQGVVIAASGMPPLPAGQTFQVWFVMPDDPVSVGFARADAAGRLFESLESVPDASELIAIAVTLEPEGGVETPSGNVLLLGRTSP